MNSIGTGGNAAGEVRPCSLYVEVSALAGSCKCIVVVSNSVRTTLEKAAIVVMVKILQISIVEV